MQDIKYSSVWLCNNSGTREQDWLYTEAMRIVRQRGLYGGGVRRAVYCSFRYGNIICLIDWLIDWLIEWMVLYATFNRISVISWRQLTLFISFLGFTSTIGWALKCLAQGHSQEKPRGSSGARTRTPGLRVKHFTTEPCISLNESAEKTS